MTTLLMWHPATGSFVVTATTVNSAPSRNTERMPTPCWLDILKACLTSLRFLVALVSPAFSCVWTASRLSLHSLDEHIWGRSRYWFWDLVVHSTDIGRRMRPPPLSPRSGPLRSPHKYTLSRHAGIISRSASALGSMLQQTVSLFLKPLSCLWILPNPDTVALAAASSPYTQL
jgi:hypothetical protein